MFEQINTVILHAILFSGLYFQIFLLVTLIEEKTEQKNNFKHKVRKSKEWTYYPTVSITIPCFNEATTLQSTVLSLLKLEYPKDKLSILVVDDGSTDNTSEVAKKLQEKYPQIKVCRQENGGKYTALNFGLSQSNSDIVGCLDADSSVDKIALIKMIEKFEDKSVMAVTPAIRVYNPVNILQMIQKAEYNMGIILKQLLGRIGAIHVTPGPFSLFRRQVFETIGKYRHAHNTEDMEIAFRMHVNKLKIVNCPEAFVFTVTPKTLKALYKQRVRWIYGFLKNSIDYRFLFLNKKYGNLGMLTLPFSMLFVFTALYIISRTIIMFYQIVENKIVELITIGFHFKIPTFHWFYINTGTITLMGILLVAGTIYVMLQGKKIAEGSSRPSLDILYFILFYGLISPLWLTKALYNTILSKKTPWR